MPWLADSMTNDLKHAFGDRNNSEFVISPEGKVVISRTWSSPDQLRGDLEKLVGKSDTLTKVKNTRQQKTKVEYPSGIVDRVPRPDGATALKVVAQNSEEPHYVKARVEATSEVTRGDGGELHIGFHLDPIHHVHWNNLAPPLKWEIKSPEGVSLSASKGEAPKVEEKADIDPREFLLKIDGNSSDPLKLIVQYYACDNDDKWCKAVTQEYHIKLENDKDAGRIAGAKGSRGGKGKGGGMSKGKGKGMSGKGKGKGGSRPDPAAMVKMMDSNKDGKIGKDEVRGRMAERFSQIDTDEDGFVTIEELKKRFEGR